MIGAEGFRLLKRSFKAASTCASVTISALASTMRSATATCFTASGASAATKAILAARRHSEAERHEFSRREQTAEYAPTRIAVDVLEKQRRPFDIGGLAHARGDLVLDADFIFDAQELFLAFEMSEKASQIFKHGGSLTIGVSSDGELGYTRTNFPALQYSITPVLSST